MVLEQQLAPLAPHFEEALAGVMPVSRLIRTALVSVERNPRLLEYDRQSFFNTIMSSGVLGLEMDGVTGQAFPVPFGNKVQLIIGYKGYNTLGARGGITITGDVVRDGDGFEFQKGTDAFVIHKPKLGNTGRIIGAWSVAAAIGRPPIVEVLGIDELMAVKAKSPGARKSDSPWNNPEIGFPAMCAKTAKRRLARSTPLTVMTLAARMEEAHEEQGRLSYIQKDRTLVIEADSPLPQPEPTPQPTAGDLTRPRPTMPPIGEAAMDDLKCSLTIAAQGGQRSLRAHWKNKLDPAERAAAKQWEPELLEIANKSDAAIGGA